MPADRPKIVPGQLARYVALVALVLAIPIVPFVLAGDWIEQQVAAWLTPSQSATSAAALVVTALAADVLLPVPSSLLSTWAGARLGILGGALVVWTGMMSGATLGFVIGRVGGRPLVERWVSADDLARLQGLVEKQGWWMLIVTRPLPVLAEAAVLLLGSLRLPWRAFLWGVGPVSLAIALAYATLGALARESQWTAVALVVSVIVPLAATALARRALSSALANR